MAEAPPLRLIGSVESRALAFAGKMLPGSASSSNKRHAVEGAEEAALKRSKAASSTGAAPAPAAPPPHPNAAPSCPRMQGGARGSRLLQAAGGVMPCPWREVFKRDRKVDLKMESVMSHGGRGVGLGLLSRAGWEHFTRLPPCGYPCRCYYK